MAEGGRHGGRRPDAAGRHWPLIAAWARPEERLGLWAARRGPIGRGLYEFARFGVKQGWACLFGGLLLGLVVGTRLIYPPGALVPRYDALVMAALLIQIVFLWSRLETIEEAKVILVFHAVGTAMEVFKTATGSWAYPEPSVLRIGAVPLFTGFMYAAVGSYLARAWRLFDLRFTGHPMLPALFGLSVAIYLKNFFADHWGLDLRYGLIAAAALLFGRTQVVFRVWIVDRSMPLLVGFALVTLFIWFGENIGTAGGAWLYPNQAKVWTVVSTGKLTSWFLLMLVSYTLVAATMLPRPPCAVPDDTGPGPAGASAVDRLAHRTPSA